MTTKLSFQWCCIERVGQFFPVLYNFCNLSPILMIFFSDLTFYGIRIYLKDMTMCMLLVRLHRTGLLFAKILDSGQTQLQTKFCKLYIISYFNTYSKRWHSSMSISLQYGWINRYCCQQTGSVFFLYVFLSQFYKNIF